MNYNSLFDAYMDEVCVYVGGINGDNKFSVDHFDFCRLKSAEIEPLILITIGGLAINKLSPRLALELYPNNILCQILTQFWSKEAPPLPSTVLNHMADYHSQIHTMSVSDSCHPQLIRQRRRGKGHNYLNKKTQKTISRVMWQGLPTSYRHQMIQCLSYCVGE
ncbi:hypothetical protein BCV71DRAFT_277549 [Rhizopus microsporus]|uniref:Uncharacterized protein n=1 Tax=Rhizopus microsporus TaxID=58291 RepID=A0A1X0SA32_RHIZD|nr:hypothetical protein BCV71DRAFT_277549 [Rhizopus microsporus]